MTLDPASIARRAVRSAGRVAHALTALPLVAAAAHAQWTVQPAGTTADLRGIAAVSATVAWASGTRGTVLRTTDGGTHWQAFAVPGADSLDFRDVEAFGATTAVALAAGPGRASRVYRTTDGGRHWALTFTNPDSAGFLDAIAFWDARRGLAFGDPVDGRFTIFRTEDGGVHWTRGATAGMPRSLPGEGGFAASGTCLVVRGTGDAWFATGGAEHARVFRSRDGGRTWTAAEVPIAAGKASAGVFSLAFRDGRRGVAVGGDYQAPNAAAANVALTDDGGATWTAAPGPLPAGYRSGAAYAGRATAAPLVAVGTSGSSRSADAGRAWSDIDAANYNAVAFTAGGTGWAVGPRGLVARWTRSAR